MSNEDEKMVFSDFVLSTPEFCHHQMLNWATGGTNIITFYCGKKQKHKDDHELNWTINDVTITIKQLNEEAKTDNYSVEPNP